MSKLIHITRSKYRVLVSDTLPYERPLFFTNRFFARFLKYYGVVCKDGRLLATKNHSDGIEDMLSIIGGQSGDIRKAFQYSINKDGTEDTRTLTVIHPYHQVQMVEFYDRYKVNMQEVFDLREVLREKELLVKGEYIFVNPKYIYVMNEILIKII